MAKTLVFCTSYVDQELRWTTRYRLWLNAIRGSAIACDHVLLVDDGSPLLPAWSDTRITSNLTDTPSIDAVTLFHFDTRLGRQARTVYPGWYRSFCLAARYADIHGFDKVVHIESDGFIISLKMQHYINEISDGWIAPAIQSHDMPESAIQIMAGSGLRSYIEFARTPYSELVGNEAENVIPFTHIERRFIGSRYGETLRHVPRDADFVTQTNPSMATQRDYYWWIRDVDWALPVQHLGAAADTGHGRVEIPVGSGRSTDAYLDLEAKRIAIVPPAMTVADQDDVAVTSPQFDFVGSEKSMAINEILANGERSVNLYLDLLAKCIIGTIYKDPSISPGSEGIFDPGVRNTGGDWPSMAHSMIGTIRMQNVRLLVETVLRLGIPGDFIETGVWRGGACIMMRGILQARGVTNRRVFVADSFQGIPEPDPRYGIESGSDLHTVKDLAISRRIVEENFRAYGLLDDQVEFLEGWFKDTLGQLPGNQRFALIRLDGDLYSSTMDALTALYPRLSPGGFCIIDDYALEMCAKAVQDYRHANGIREAINRIDDYGVWWQKAL